MFARQLLDDVFPRRQRLREPASRTPPLHPHARVLVAARFDDQRALVEETLRLRAEAEAARADAAAMRGQVNSMAAANQRLQGGFVCQICQDEEIDRILVPCGHMICQGCLGRLRSRSCPFCRQNFATTCPFHKSYLANDD